MLVNRIKTIFYLFALGVCLTFAWPWSQRQATAQDSISLTLGIYQSDKATVMHRKFKPILNYLETHLTDKLNQPVKFGMRIFKGYDEANDAIVRGHVDFVRFGPASYVQAKSRNADIELIVMEKRKGKNYFYGVIIVPNKSSVQSLAQLKGKRFAFGNQHSTIGRYLSQGALVEAGIFGKDLAAFDYLGRHDKVFKVVALGKYDAGALKETSVSRYNKKNEVRIIHRFKNVTKPWIARSGLDRQVLTDLRTALLELTDAKILKELKISGFQQTTDADYEVTRKEIKMADKFGG